MSRQADCYACVTGDHPRHNRDWGITPGLIGGQYCGCTGDCADRAKAAADALGKWFAEAFTPSEPTP